MTPTVSTLGASGGRFRDRTVWSASTSCDAMTTGSTLRCGAAPCDCLPLTVIQNWSMAASAGPGVYPTRPTGMSATV